jgi:hypothetical protein
LPAWLEWLAWGAAAISLALYVGFATNGFWGDDWELGAQAVRGASLADPISSHLRPMVRALFLLFRWTDSPGAFHSISILFHLLTALAIYSVTKPLYGLQIGRLSALCFFAAFPANEAVFWTSAVGVVLCLLFSLLALRAWTSGRPIVAAALLVPASLSYELWLVAIPLFFLVRRGRARDWLPTFAVFGVFVLAYMRNFGSGGVTAYGGWKWTAIPERLATYAYHVVAPTSASVGTIAALVLLAALLAGALWAPTLRLPVVLYLSSTAILALAETEIMVSRFCYFPQLAIVLVVLLLKDTGRIGRWVGTGLAAYLLIASPLWIFVDGEDYRDLATFYTKVAISTNSALAKASPGDSFGVLNKTTPAQLIELVQGFRGRPKAAFVRGAGLYGALYLPDIVTLELYARGLAPEENQTCSGRRLEFGDGPPVARYCFDVVAYPARRNR